MKTLVICACAVAASLLADDSKSLLPAPEKAESWRFEQHEGGKGSLKAVDGAIEVAGADDTPHANRDKCRPVQH